METLVFVLVAHFTHQPDKQLTVYDPKACAVGTPAECMIGGYDSCRSELSWYNASREGGQDGAYATCELMDRAKAHPILPVTP
jgi:hypothetical protein